MSLTTAFTRIEQAVVDALLQAPALADGHVRLAGVDPVPAEWLQHIDVRIDSADVETLLLGGPRLATSRVTLELFGRAQPGATARDALDALLADVDTRILALDLTALGVTNKSDTVRLQWDVDLGATQVLSVVYAFDIQHDLRAAGLRVS